MTLSPAELEELSGAKRTLENPSLIARLSDFVGTPLETAFKLLPPGGTALVRKATRMAVEKALEVAARTLGRRHPGTPANLRHKVAVGATGAAGGFFGLGALAVELPVSTAVMLRSIAEIARSEGEDLSRPETRLECIQVLALGGRAKSDDATETGYFAVRMAMAKALSEGAAHLAQRGLAETGAPIVVRWISQVASRFSVVVSQKVAAQAVPVVGALGGATVNTLFMDHFQRVAKAHFTVRRLERRHGAEAVQRAYEDL